MGRRVGLACGSVGGRGADPQLPTKMDPLERELPPTQGNASGGPGPPGLGGVEPVPAPSRLGVYAGQIRIDRCQRCGVRAEALELRMMPVAPGAALKNGLGEQGFTPERHQTLGVQVARVNGPDPQEPWRLAIKTCVARSPATIPVHA